jgi:hypothetical protein
VENFVEDRANRFAHPLFSAVYTLCPVNVAHPTLSRINEMQIVSYTQTDFAIAEAAAAKIGTFAQS